MQISLARLLIDNSVEAVGLKFTREPFEVDQERDILVTQIHAPKDIIPDMFGLSMALLYYDTVTEKLGHYRMTDSKSRRASLLVNQNTFTPYQINVIHKRESLISNYLEMTKLLNRNDIMDKLERYTDNPAVLLKSMRREHDALRQQVDELRIQMEMWK